MSDKEFTIDDAITRYQNIADQYQKDILSEDMAKEELDALNKKCKESGVVFKAEFKSLELYTTEEDSFAEDEDWSSLWDEDLYF